MVVDLLSKKAVVVFVPSVLLYPLLYIPYHTLLSIHNRLHARTHPYIYSLSFPSPHTQTNKQTNPKNYNSRRVTPLPLRVRVGKTEWEGKERKNEKGGRVR